MPADAATAVLCSMRYIVSGWSLWANQAFRFAGQAQETANALRRHEAACGCDYPFHYVAF